MATTLVLWLPCWAGSRHRAGFDIVALDEWTCDAPLDGRALQIYFPPLVPRFTWPTSGPFRVATVRARESAHYKRAALREHVVVRCESTAPFGEHPPAGGRISAE